MKRLLRWFVAGCIAAGAGSAVAVDWPTDESACRKQLELWLKDADHAEQLRRNLAAFRSLPAEAQDRLRQLDRAMSELDANSRHRLFALMERYAGWRARLSEKDRATVDSSSAGSKRIKVIGEILERQWEESLPPLHRDQLAKATGDDRQKLIEQYRQRDEDRHKVALDARRMVDEAAIFGGQPLTMADFRLRTNTAVDESLRPILSPADDARLANAPRALNSRYLQVVLELAEGKLPLPFPGPSPPGRRRAYRNWRDLPNEIVKKFSTKELNSPPLAVSAAEGKWPDLPLAVVAFAKSRGIEIPTELLGPTKADELPASVQKWLRDELTPKLSEAQKKQLLAAVGKWPDYPKKVKELADHFRMEVPGISLPGNRETWQRIRNMRPDRTPPT